MQCWEESHQDKSRWLRTGDAAQAFPCGLQDTRITDRFDTEHIITAAILGVERGHFTTPFRRTTSQAPLAGAGAGAGAACWCSVLVPGCKQERSHVRIHQIFRSPELQPSISAAESSNLVQLRRTPSQSPTGNRR
ncbi:hypothetical protein CTA1_1016 [Colletotrichum tanaceti]|uniref:Uncharacterized protein n=1 Tax=Colletotrichum tanaceti TaxID=1306861 RepID=A0A4U6X083_9PEZI|nr:hypothetical protein CTA1_1016 [Colletotrichum tanaceti]